MAQAQLAEKQPAGHEPSPQHLAERLQGIVSRLEAEAVRRVGQRATTEERWLQDLRQYHGRYEDKVLKALQDAKKSTLFIGITRAKTNTMEARLGDMLFPTDDRNWGIAPTPVPELSTEAKQAAREVLAEKPQIDDMPDSPAKAAKMNAIAARQKVADQLKAEMDEAKKRAESMQAECEDQLKECRYEIECREAIRDACRIGTGIMKGPVLTGRMRRNWRKRQVTGENGAVLTVHELVEGEDARAAFLRVDPWSFFPSPDARTAEESEDFYERHLMVKKQVRKLASQPGFDANAIRALLSEDPRESMPQYMVDLRSLTGEGTTDTTKRYQVWEYHGPLEAEEIRDLALATSNDNLLADADIDPENIDPLVEICVTIWFCQGKILKLGLHPLDSNEAIYSVFNLEKDDASLFGFGIPYIIRDSQAALNGAWRMMMDNAGYSTGPQVVINQSAVEPADGDWILKGSKVWLKTAEAPNGPPVFEVYNIDGHQAELAGIIELAMRNIDQESNLPIIAQGDQGAHVTQTAQGMTILMNATNVVFRRIVKNFDDDMTTPNLRRLYDWNMQFSDKEHIKGDFEVDARGTSVLLVREMQAQNLMVMASNFSGHPVLGPLTKTAPLYRRLVQAHMLPADEIVLTDDEIAEAAAREAENPEKSPEMLKLEAQYNLKNMELKAKMELAMIERDTRMMELAASQNITLDQIKASLAQVKMQTDSKERIFAGEAAMTARMKASEAQKPEAARAGGGGYL